MTVSDKNFLLLLISCMEDEQVLYQFLKSKNDEKQKNTVIVIDTINEHFIASLTDFILDRCSFSTWKMQRTSTRNVRDGLSLNTCIPGSTPIGFCAATSLMVETCFIEARVVITVLCVWGVGCVRSVELKK